MLARHLFGWMLLAPAGVALAAPVPDTRVIEAVRKGDKVLLRNLLQQGIDANTPLGDGVTALHWAAYQDDVESTDLLIAFGAAVDRANDLGVTPLWVASSGGNASVIARLLKSGADPNLAPSTGGTALMRAARSGKTMAVKLLLSAGADVNAKEAGRGQTALMWAVSQQHPEIVQALIDAGADVNARTNKSRQFVLICCQEHNRDPGDTRWLAEGEFTPLLFAARVGAHESARRLLAAGAQVDAATPEGATPLVIAAQSGHGSVAILLLEKGADPNAANAGYTPLHAAVLRDDLKLVKALLAGGANPNVRLTKGTQSRRGTRDYAFYRTWIGATPVWMAAGFQKPALIQELAANGADVQLTTEDGTTPLMAAARGEHSKAVFQNAYPILPPGEEKTALETLKLLIELGAKVNIANRAGDTTLHRAASNRFDSVVQFLDDHGAALDAKDREGRTPLACAVRHCHLFSNTKGSFVAAAWEAIEDTGVSTAKLLRELGAKQ